MRCQKKIDHQHNFRSKPNFITHHLHTNLTEYEIEKYVFDTKMPVNHIDRDDGKRETIDSLLARLHKEVLERSLINYWGRLSQGNDFGTKGSEAIKFTHKTDVLSDKMVICESMICNFRPLKHENHRVRVTLGGDMISYAQDAGSPAANLLETKILLNSIMCDARKGARFMCLDIKDNFLATTMSTPEQMRV